MRKDHEECQYCYFCGEYFGMEKSLKYHNRQYHKEIEVHDHKGINNVEVMQHENTKKKKKRKGRK